MSKSNAAENKLLLLLFNSTSWANIATGSGVSQLFVALHTADPGEGGTQSTSEATYTGYARIAVDRDNTGWTISANSVANAEEILFGLCTVGSETITHASVGPVAVGATEILYKGALASSIPVAPNIAPRIAPGGFVITED